MKWNRVIRWAANAALTLGVAGQAGIARGEGLWLNDGMLAPRSGEIFQTTAKTSIISAKMKKAFILHPDFIVSLSVFLMWH